MWKENAIAFYDQLPCYILLWDLWVSIFFNLDVYSDIKFATIVWDKLKIFSDDERIAIKIGLVGSLTIPTLIEIIYTFFIYKIGMSSLAYRSLLFLVNWFHFDHCLYLP